MCLPCSVRRLPHGRRGLKCITVQLLNKAGGGRLPHGRRGLKSVIPAVCCLALCGRLPHGRRGLKWLGSPLQAGIESSPPSREAWIEIGVRWAAPKDCKRRLPHGRRGLKFVLLQFRRGTETRRLPHGRRGLK